MSDTCTIYTRRLPKEPLKIRQAPPPRRQRTRWCAVEVTHVECLEDFAGNSDQPGLWADLWKDSLGNRFIHFGGAWDYYHNKPMHRPPIRVPRWARAAEVPTRNGKFEFDPWNRSSKPLPKKPLVFEYADKPLEQLRKLFNVKGVLMGDYNMISSGQWTKAQRLKMQELVKAVGPTPISVLSWQPLETLDGRLRVDQLHHPNRYVISSLYQVSRDGKVWFHTPNYSLVLRAIDQHIKKHMKKFK